MIIVNDTPGKDPLQCTRGELQVRRDGFSGGKTPSDPTTKDAVRTSI